MDDFLTFYERELSLMHKRTKEFSEQYPKVSARFSMFGEHTEDPSVERLIQSFAFLSAGVRQKLDDDYSEFTDAFLQVLYPHYLRPIPSCSVVQVDCLSLNAVTGVARKCRSIPKKTQLSTDPVNVGVPCHFQTIYDVDVSPLKIASARYESIVVAPRQVTNGRLHPNVSGAIGIEFDLSGLGETGFEQLEFDAVRVFIDAERVLATQIREAILYRALQVVLDIEGEWHVCPEGMVQEVGFSLDEPLLPYNSRTPAAYRLLTEFFVFNDKFNFFDISIAGIKNLKAQMGSRFTLKFLLPEAQGPLLNGRVLEQVETSNFKLHCTPVVNLFRTQGIPVVAEYPTEKHTLLADLAHPELHEVYDVVRIGREGGGLASFDEFKPFYSLYHGEFSKRNAYWHLVLDRALMDLQPGYEYQLSLTDADQNPSKEQLTGLLIDILRTNRNLPFSLKYGLPEGDLWEKSSSAEKPKDTKITFLKRPTRSMRFARERDSQWRFISHMNMTQLTLGFIGVDALKEIVDLYNVNQSKSIRRMSDGIVKIRHAAKRVLMPDQPAPRLARGLEVVIQIQPEHFVETGVGLFAKIFDLYFARLVRENSFSHVIIQHAETQMEIFQCPPQTGHLPLL